MLKVSVTLQADQLKYSLEILNILKFVGFTVISACLELTCYNEFKWHGRGLMLFGDIFLVKI
jgi:hypothetical protein